MSQNQKVTLYGIEAELPPGGHLLGVGLATAKPLMLGCNDGKGQQVFCFNQWWVEIFAATAVCRWDDIVLAGKNDTLVARAEAQSEKWRAIRDAAIRKQKP